MTTIQERLSKKPIIEATAIEVTEEPPIQGDELDKELTEEPQLPALPEEENPFGDSGDDQSAIDATVQLMDPTNRMRLGMIANNRAPRVLAVSDSISDWEESEGEKELAELDRNLVRNILIHGCGQEGKHNRAELVAGILKALNQFEQEQKLAAGPKAFERR